ncbi:MAG: hypothetical protein L6W00_21375 [Lentisphaeria bacterium]|nr:MAG: hypothetical protein L6W00_21375 [Lentisphaeria bacterium]
MKKKILKNLCQEFQKVDSAAEFLLCLFLGKVNGFFFLCNIFLNDGYTSFSIVEFSAEPTGTHSTFKTAVRNQIAFRLSGKQQNGE